MRLSSLGKHHRHGAWEKDTDNLEIGLLVNCVSCKALQKLKLEILSQPYSDMFEKKPVTYNYISSDKADMRMFFPSLGKDFYTERGKLGAEQMGEAINDTTIVCISQNN